GEFVDIFAQHRLPAVNDIEDQIVAQQLANHLGLLVQGGVVGELLEKPLQPGPAGGSLYLQDGGQQADRGLQARGVVDGDNGLVVRQNGADLPVAGGALYRQDGGRQTAAVRQARGVVDGDNGLVVRQNGAALHVAGGARAGCHLAEAAVPQQGSQQGGLARIAVAHHADGQGRISHG